jgi:hypothetical protein
MRREICAKTAELRPEAHRVSVCRELKQQARDDLSFISSILTGDETWVYGYDPETKQQSSQWKSPNSPRPRRTINMDFTLLRTWRSQQCWSFFSTSKELSTMKSYPLVKPSIARFTWGFEAAEGGHSAKRPEKWKNNKWFIHHDNAPAHTSLVIRQFPTSKSITMSPHAPIRLISSPATFSYSPRWNYGWKGVVLTRLRKSMQNRKRLSTHSCLRTSRDAWNHRKHAGIAVYMPKGTTSKKTVETRSCGKKLFYGHIPRCFG